jgi:hypothetical protein
MTRTRLTWVIAAGVSAVFVAGTVDAIRSPGSPSNQAPATKRSAARETTFSVRTTPKSLPRCTFRHIGVSIDVLGGTAAVVVRHVWGSPCHLAPLPVRLSVTDRVGRRVRLATLDGVSESGPRVQGDFAPGFEELIDITYLPSCGQRGPFTAFVIVGPYSAQRKLSGSEVGCFRGG